MLNIDFCDNEKISELTARLRCGMANGRITQIPTLTRQMPKVVRPATDSEDQTLTFVDALYEPDDLVEIRRLPTGESTWGKASDLSSELARLHRQNDLSKQHIYIGPNPRKQTGNRGDSNVLLARTLFVDFDNTTIEEARARIDAADFPLPTVCVNSGHGCHAYWLLNEPITDLTQWRHLQKRLATLLGSDQVVCNPERIMRLPGFVNHKPPVASCELIEHDRTRVHLLKDVRRLLPDNVGEERSSAPPLPAKIGAGERNQWMTSFMGSMRRRDAGEETMLAAARIENEVRCDPPLSEDELRAIARSMAKYPASIKSSVTKPVSVPVLPKSHRPFPTEILPEPFARFISETATAQGSDESQVAVPLLVGAASAIGTSRTVELKPGWREFPVLWAAVIANSGSMKSPAQEAALFFVLQRQKKLWKDYQQAYAEYESDLQKRKAMPRADRGEEPQPPPPSQHVVCSDVTVEALVSRLEDTPRGTLVAVDELSGWLSSFGQYKSGHGGSDVAHYLSMHRGGAVKVDRKQSDQPTIFVPSAAVSIVGGIQPSIFRRCMTREFLENGLAARLLVTMPPERMKIWTEAVVDPETIRVVASVFDFLFSLQPSRGIGNGPEPAVLPLTEKAKARWVNFYNRHAEEQHELSGTDLAATWSKLESYAARFALIIHCIREAIDDVGSDPFHVDESSIEAGIKLAEYFGHEAKRVHATFNESEENRTHRTLIERIQTWGGRVSVRELMRSCKMFKNTEDLTAALDALVTANIGKFVYARTASSGPPAKFFELLPQ